MSTTFNPVQMVISRKENKQHVKIGEQTIFVPTLSNIIQFVTSPIKKDEKGAEVFEDGIPVYEADEANWVQAAILASVKAQARNKMLPGTATVKDGQKIADDWAGLTAEGVRDGSGLALAREFKEAFKDWLGKQGISDQAATVLHTLVSNKAALALQQQSTKEKVRARLEAFADSLDEATAERFLRPMESVLEATQESADPLADL